MQRVIAVSFRLESYIWADPTRTRLIVILFWDFATEVPQVILPRFEPNVFAQATEKYKISVGSLDKAAGKCA
jgi:hypothetical protein